LQGIIKDDYIPINLLSEIELEVVPDLMKEIKFIDPEKNDVVSNEKIDNLNHFQLNSNSENMFTQTGMELILAKNGKFIMGNTLNFNGDSDEKPAHEVVISYDFYIGKNEVTFEDFDEYYNDMNFEEKDDKGWGRDKQPVMHVYFLEAIKFCNWLSEKENLKPAYDGKGNLIDSYGRKTDKISEVEGYRLPTEAEWEYAARGGHKSTEDFLYSGSNVMDEVGWYAGNSDNKSHEVCLKAGNELGLYDMSGNVWEWCFDYYSDTYYQKSQKNDPLNTEKSNFRVMRGGSFTSSIESERISARSFFNEDYSSNNIGFRIVRRK
jgi:formylglycine-generating enzyme required for sulfatase activity